MATGEAKKPFPEEELPFMYQDPFNMYVFWTCGRDEEGKLLSTFTNAETDKGEKYHAYLTEEEALMQRKLLRKQHWQPMKKPQFTIQSDKDFHDGFLVAGEREPKEGDLTVRQRLRKKLDERKGKEPVEKRIW